MTKIYESKLGLKFVISPIAKPADGDVVYFSQAEWDYMKSQKLDPEQFKIVWNLKKENHRYSMMPEDEPKPINHAYSKIGNEIIEMLRGKNVEKGK